MSRIRTIKPDWLDDERMALASSDARVLSIALIVTADDYGNGRCPRMVLAARVFPGSPVERFDVALAELCDVVQFAKTYEIDGQRYFSIRNWAKHQKVDHPGKPQVPGPPEVVKKSRKSSRDSREALATDSETLAKDSVVLAPRASPPLQSSESETGSGSDARVPVDDHETPIPQDIVERCEKHQLPEQFAKAYRAPIETVRHEIHEILTYWTIGGGAGVRKRLWMRVVRTRLHELGKEGRLNRTVAAAEPDPETLKTKREAFEREVTERKQREVAEHLAQRGKPPGSSNASEAKAAMDRLVEGA